MTAVSARPYCVPVIFKKKPEAPDLGTVISELEQAVEARDGGRTETAFAAVLTVVQSATDAECAAAGPRLAALLPLFPPVGPRPMLAMAAGFCVERGADPLACAEPVLDAVREDLLAAREFARLWGAGELPEPDEKIIDAGLAARLGLDGDEYEATRLALAWCALEQWQPPALAVLCRSAEVRRRHAAALLSVCRELAALEQHDLKCLAYALAVLDDEPLVVLHRPTGRGFEVRIGGIGDNFQLHTLLAHTLVGGGHLPGTAPCAESVRLATDPAPAQGMSGVVALGAFELLAPDGERIWNEGLPDDIPVVDGRRLLVLDEPVYPRSWNADRFFPHLAGSAELIRVLPDDETRTWFARTA
ncbi:hypothetical protein GCM10010329_48490 [Streptomyces spiroverticillatus]|uniref:Uncharacterized protein n=1 Tax=Streptomyces finlayi TaxID=67296 RepID=A0A918X1D4_9ACTN|nr:hypothetical protein [Streptomyces finlayi]GHA19772.1 hypothetical protein GCM10010329_48490 [Streptomyces spiroverticillatus]GHD02641.1 hypothetical protein GCM10010334_49440 [Streptomyces finlayi]